MCEAQILSANGEIYAAIEIQSNMYYSLICD
jgi:hypothetical protein